MIDNKMSSDQIRSLVNSKTDWWHTITLPYGIKTPGLVTEKTQDWNAQIIPTDLKGLTVLDIGAWDGYYSFLCEQRGASVTAIDSMMRWGGMDGFEISRKILNSKVKYIQMDVIDVEKLNTVFDIVLYFGVYYHLKNPLLVFEILRKITKQSLLFEGHFIDVDGKPLMFFYPNSELSGDGSNWWEANQQCLEDMLRVAGFNKVTTINKSIDTKVTVYNENQGRILIKADV